MGVEIGRSALPLSWAFFYFGLHSSCLKQLKVYSMFLFHII